MNLLMTDYSYIGRRIAPTAVARCPAKERSAHPVSWLETGSAGLAAVASGGAVAAGRWSLSAVGLWSGSDGLGFSGAVRGPQDQGLILAADSPRAPQQVPSARSPGTTISYWAA